MCLMRSLFFKFQSICLQIELTTYFKSFVAFWVSCLSSCLGTVIPMSPFDFSTLSYSTIKFVTGLHYFASLRSALKILRLAQEWHISCNPMPIITCIISDAIFSKQMLNEVVLPLLYTGGLFRTSRRLCSHVVR